MKTHAMNNLLVTNILLLLCCFLSITGCSMTRSLDEFGIKYISPHDQQQAALLNNNLLLLESNTSVKWGTSRSGRITQKTMLMECDISKNITNTTDITNNLYKNSLPINIIKYLESKSDYNILLAGWSKCTVGDNFNELPDNKILVFDNDILITNNDHEIFFYVDRPSNFYPQKKYLLINQGKDIYVINITYASKQKKKTFWRHLKYPLYPVMVALDIVTFPIQLYKWLNEPIGYPR